jgi:hypothetical protein
MDSVTGAVRMILRLEGLAALVVSVAVYAYWGQHGWGFFALLFLAPDLSLLGYLRGPRVGAAVYNFAHTYVVPAVLGIAGVLWLGPLFTIALIWSAHIGLDRMLGYGLKLPTAFQSTHLGPIGRARPAQL